MKRADKTKPLVQTGRITASLVAFGLLAGCSYVPDSLNPVEWYRSTVDLFSDDPAAGEGGLVADANAPKPAENKDFPKVSEVPTSAPSGLSGDNQGRRYAGDVVAGQSAARAPLRPGGASMAAAEAPPPPAVPAMPVARADMDAHLSQPAKPYSPASADASRRSVASAQPKMALKPPAMPEPMKESFQAGLSAGLPANAEMPGFGAGYDTVVISSDGIEQADPRGASLSGTVSPLASTRPRMPSGTPSGPVYDLAQAGAQPMPRSGTVKVATILFPNGSARLSPEDVKILREVRTIHQQRGGTIRVVGHASSRTRNMDPLRHKMINFQVSVDRADAVAKTLVRLGAPANQVAVNAVADAQPLYYEVMPAGEAGNRRTEIFITY